MARVPNLEGSLDGYCLSLSLVRNVCNEDPISFDHNNEAGGSSFSSSLYSERTCSSHRVPLSSRRRPRALVKTLTYWRTGTGSIWPNIQNLKANATIPITNDSSQSSLIPSPMRQMTARVRFDTPKTITRASMKSETSISSYSG